MQLGVDAVTLQFD